MNQMIQVKYEDNVFKPINPLKGLKKNETAWVIFCSHSNKKHLEDLIGTLTKDEAEAEEMYQLIDKEFSRIEGEW
ncbi:UPF0165 [Desulfonema limicola]|uniref:UPF0165 n=1 Tax=Desulfonema limicola TaxID=45656 RepID=A0A975GJB7_9BACT|nr:antitoxin AF2212-like protein [Desulfonema limicola]QTA83531.1 UPF0165 [Desulfonema limicola]